MKTIDATEINSQEQLETPEESIDIETPVDVPEPELVPVDKYIDASKLESGKYQVGTNSFIVKGEKQVEQKSYFPPAQTNHTVAVKDNAMGFMDSLYYLYARRMSGASWDEVGNEIMEMKDDKTKAFEKIAEDIKSASPEMKHVFAIGNSLAQALTFQEVPEVSQALVDGNFNKMSFAEQIKYLKDNPSSATYLVASMGATVARDMALTYLTGGGLLSPAGRYWLFQGISSLGSGVEAWQNIEEQERVSGNVVENKYKYSLAAGGSSFLSGFLGYHMSKRMFDPMIKKYIASEAFGRSLVYGAAGAMDGGLGAWSEMATYNFANDIASKTEVGLSTFTDVSPFHIMMGSVIGGSMHMVNSRNYIDLLKDNIKKEKASDESARKLVEVETEIKERIDNGIQNVYSGYPIDIEKAKNVAVDSYYKVFEKDKRAYSSYANEDVKQEIKSVSEETWNTLRQSFDIKSEHNKSVEKMLDSLQKGGEETKNKLNFTVQDVKNNIMKPASNSIINNMYDSFVEKAVDSNLTRDDIAKLWQKNLASYKKEDGLISNFIYKKVSDGLQNQLSSKEIAYDISDTMFQSNPALRDIVLERIESFDFTKEKTKFDNTDANNIRDVVMKAVDEFSNFETFSGIYRNVDKINSAMGGEPLLPISDYIDNPVKPMMSSGKFKEHATKFLKLETDFHNKMIKNQIDFREDKTLALSKWIKRAKHHFDRLYFELSGDPILKDAVKSLYESSRTVGSKIAKVNARNAQFLHSDPKVSLTDYVTEHNVDMSKVQKYLNTIYDMQTANQDVNVKKRTLFGTVIVDTVSDVADALKMTDHEIVAAHKTANFLQQQYEIAIKAREATAPYAPEYDVVDLPTFSETDMNFKGHSYFPTKLNKAGSDRIKAQIKDDSIDDLASSMFHARKYDSMLRSNPEEMLPPMVALEQHAKSLSYAIGLSGYNKSLDTMFNILTPSDLLNKHKNSFGLKKYRDIARDLRAKDQKSDVYRRLDLILDNHDSALRGAEKDVGTSIVDTALAPVTKVMIPLFISTARATYTLANLLEGFNTSMHISGVKNYAKSLPEGFKFMKNYLFGKDRMDARTIMKDVVKKYSSVNAPYGLNLGKTVESYFNSSYQDKSATGYFTGESEGVQFAKPAASIAIKNKLIKKYGRAKGMKLFGALDWTHRLFLEGNDASDMSSRLIGIGSAFNLVEKKLKQYSWTPKSPEHAAEKLSRIVDELGINSFGVMAHESLTNLLVEGLNNNNLQPFMNEYAYQFIDNSLWHYDIMNKHALYTKSKALGSLGQTMTAFTSYPIYSIDGMYRDFMDGVSIRDNVKAGKPIKGSVMRLSTIAITTAIGIMAKVAYESSSKKEKELFAFTKKLAYDRNKFISSGNYLYTPWKNRYSDTLLENYADLLAALPKSIAKGSSKPITKELEYILSADFYLKDLNPLKLVTALSTILTDSKGHLSKEEHEALQEMVNSLKEEAQSINMDSEEFKNIQKEVNEFMKNNEGE